MAALPVHALCGAGAPCAAGTPGRVVGSFVEAWPPGGHAVEVRSGALKRALDGADAWPMYADLRPYDERLLPPAPALSTPDRKAGIAASTKKLVGSWWERAKRSL